MASNKRKDKTDDDSVIGNSRLKLLSTNHVNLIPIIDGGGSSHIQESRRIRNSLNHLNSDSNMFQELAAATPMNRRIIIDSDEEYDEDGDLRISFNISERNEEKMKNIIQSFPLKDVARYEAAPIYHGEPSSIQCNICLYPIPYPSVWSRIHCNHTFCVDCIRDYVKDKFQEQTVGILKCPQTKCKELIEPYCLEKVLPREVIDRWTMSLREASELANIRWISCPFENCGCRFVDDRKRCLMKACPMCLEIFCIRCKVVWHYGMNCVQFKRLQWRKRQPWMMNGAPDKPILLL